MKKEVYYSEVKNLEKEENVNNKQEINENQEEIILENSKNKVNDDENIIEKTDRPVQIKKTPKWTEDYNLSFLAIPCLVHNKCLKGMRRRSIRRNDFHTKPLPKGKFLKIINCLGLKIIMFCYI